MRYIGAALIALVLCSSAVRADDFGPAKDIRDVDAAAKRLLAHRIRPLETSAVTFSDTVVVKDQALLTWRADSNEAMMGLVRYAGRWWDAFDHLPPPKCPITNAVNFPLTPQYIEDFRFSQSLSAIGFTNELVSAAARHNALFSEMRGFRELCDPAYPSWVPPVKLNHDHGYIHPYRSATTGYDIWFKYIANDAPADSRITSLRARAPSPSEFLAQSAPFANGTYGTGVVFLYIDSDAKIPVNFKAGAFLNIWAPWALDDSLRYELEFYTGKTEVGPVKAAVHDNVLHFDLPAFSLPPGETMGEVDGYY